MDILEQQEKNEAAKLKAEEKSQKEHLEQLEEAADMPRKEFMSACKGSRHLTGKHEGIRKSGGTCRQEWRTLSESIE